MFNLLQDVLCFTKFGKACWIKTFVTKSNKASNKGWTNRSRFCRRTMFKFWWKQRYSQVKSLYISHTVSYISLLVKITKITFVPAHSYKLRKKNETLWNKTMHLKFIYSEKATKFCKISTLLLSYVVPVKSKVEILQHFVAFSEYMNFKTSCLYVIYGLQ